MQVPQFGRASWGVAACPNHYWQLWTRGFFLDLPSSQGRTVTQCLGLQLCLGLNPACDLGKFPLYLGQQFLNVSE